MAEAELEALFKALEALRARALMTGLFSPDDGGTRGGASEPDAGVTLRNAKPDLH
jgi:hypothetical protein